MKMMVDKYSMLWVFLLTRNIECWWKISDLTILTWKRMQPRSNITMHLISTQITNPIKPRWSDWPKNWLISQLPCPTSTPMQSMWDVTKTGWTLCRPWLWDPMELPTVMVHSSLISTLMIIIPMDLPKSTLQPLVTAKLDSIPTSTPVARSVSVCLELGEVQLPRIGIQKFPPSFKFCCLFRLSLWVKRCISMNLGSKANKELKKERRKKEGNWLKLSQNF